MTALALRSKASWGYDAAFMEACIAPLTITEAALKQTLTQVAVDPDHRILGFVMVRFDPEATHLDKLFVEPEAFGLGIGARLMGWAKSAAKARGAVALDIVSDPGAEASGGKGEN